MMTSARYRIVARVAVTLGVVLAAACASPPDVPATEPGAGGFDAWHHVALPGKTSTRYARERKEGRQAVAARSERSASLWRKRINVPAQRIGEVSFSWWVQDLIAGASVADVDREDAPARLLLGFSGDTSKLPARTRMMFELAQALTGEPPPYATLMYVWDASAPVGTVIVNPRSDRIRKIVVDSGPRHLRQWRDHRRDIAADFRLAFAEEPGALISLALMTDSDNTRSRASSWYGPVALH